MTQDELKKAAACAAIAYVEDDMIVSVGPVPQPTTSLMNWQRLNIGLKALLQAQRQQLHASKPQGSVLFDPNTIDALPLYVDGADEANAHRQLIKGGGGALTREKILATISRSFVCIIDETKRVDVLGRFPLPVEVIPMARSYVGRQIVKLGGEPILREGVITDNHNIIIDIHNINLVDPGHIEEALNQITGVVCNGLFAKRTADLLLISTQKGIERITKERH